MVTDNAELRETRRTQGKGKDEGGMGAEFRQQIRLRGSDVINHGQRQWCQHAWKKDGKNRAMAPAQSMTGAEHRCGVDAVGGRLRGAAESLHGAILVAAAPLGR